jgi:AcrR family transcriptional regulator
MPRPVDPDRYQARRLHIIDAGLTAFASHGYAGATTAVICRTAGIGSGTFFHYFPTKADLLIAILELGRQETLDFFAAQQGSSSPRQVLLDYVEHAVANLEDERAAGFIRAVGSVITDDRVADALEADERAVRDGLEEWVVQAHAVGEIRTDLPAGRIVDWLVLLIDGFSSQVAARTGFDAATEATVLYGLVDQFLTGTDQHR